MQDKSKRYFLINISFKVWLGQKYYKLCWIQFKVYLRQKQKLFVDRDSINLLIEIQLKRPSVPCESVFLPVSESFVHHYRPQILKSNLCSNLRFVRKFAKCIFLTRCRLTLCGHMVDVFKFSNGQLIHT